MNGNSAARNIRVILPVILRITFCLAMWTIGAMTMTVAEAEAQTREHRVVPQSTTGGGDDGAARGAGVHDLRFRIGFAEERR